MVSTSELPKCSRPVHVRAPLSLSNPSCIFFASIFATPGYARFFKRHSVPASRFLLCHFWYANYPGPGYPSTPMAASNPSSPAAPVYATIYVQTAMPGMNVRSYPGMASSGQTNQWFPVALNSIPDGFVLEAPTAIDRKTDVISLGGNIVCVWVYTLLSGPFLFKCFSLVFVQLSWSTLVINLIVRTGIDRCGVPDCTIDGNHQVCVSPKSYHPKLGFQRLKPCTDVKINRSNRMRKQPILASSLSLAFRGQVMARVGHATITQGFKRKDNGEKRGVFLETMH